MVTSPPDGVPGQLDEPCSPGAQWPSLLLPLRVAAQLMMRLPSSMYTYHRNSSRPSFPVVRPCSILSPRRRSATLE
jgi:hypothetical protein